ncbi:MAG: glycosyl hydrolase [Eubacteriales bacterium]
MTELQKRLNGNLRDYKSIPFWSWNDKLDPEELRRQIRQMKEAGIGGFFMHARGGLQTEYLGEDWMDVTGHCIDEAEKQDMNAWCYDENGWPSGFAGMKLLEDRANWAHYVTCEKKASFDKDALAVYVLSGGDIIRVLGDNGAAEYICLYDKTNSSVVDILNPVVVKKFIDETHELYYARFSSQFGKFMLGFFTDEPQYFRWDTAFTPVILDAYKKEYGEDVLDTLGALFVDCNQFGRLRFRYWRLMNKLFVTSFAKQIYDWCEEHGCKLTGHAVEESALFAQMWCCAGVMPFYEYEHIPGIDWLGRDISSELSPRQVSSAAMQLGKKQVLTETFACTGWDVTPAELKRIAEWQYVNGVNLMCQHLYPYSIRGQRKRDHPAFFSEHTPWFEQFRHFNDYFTALGYMLAESEEAADVAVLHPMHSAYLTYNRAADASSVAELENSFRTLIENLGAANVGHHYIDELLLEKYGDVRDGKLVMGQRSYSVVVIPEMAGLDSSTAQLLRRFAQAGGKFSLQGKIPHLVDGESADLSFIKNDINLGELCTPGCVIDKKDTDIRSTLRSSSFGTFLYTVNLSKDRDYDVTYTVKAKGAVLFDLESRDYKPVHFVKTADGISLPLHFRPGQSYVVVFEDAESAAPAGLPQLAQSLDTNATLKCFGENSLTLDYAALSYDNISFEKPIPIMALSDRLMRERQNRTIYVKYSFDVKEKPEVIFLESEKTPSPNIWFNGTKISLDTQGRLDKSFVRADIASHVKLGRNEAVFQIEYFQSEHVNYVMFDAPDGTESLKNCLSYDTDIESIYILGDFAVYSSDGFRSGAKGTSISKGSFYIAKTPYRIDMSKTNQQGFPFFAGQMCFEKDFFADRTDYKLRIKGRHAASDIYLNGSFVSRLMFDDTCSLEGHLKQGVNKLEIRTVSANRNLLGPHHVKWDPEPYGVGPSTFDNYGSWQDGESPHYTHDYAFVPFGVDSVELYL